jgi:exodeoxyribonuclease-1
MSNFVFYDLETSDSALNFSQILEASFIICNDNLEELERATFFARLNKTYIPHPGALLTNGVSVKRLKETNLSEYEMVKQIFKFLKKPGKIVSLGWNSSQFDRNVCRSTFWRNLEKPYLMNTNGNAEADLLHIARAAHLYFPGSIKTGTTSKNNPEFKLTSISKANDLKHEIKHSAESDCEATLLTAKLIKNKTPTLWESAFMTTNKSSVINLLDKELMCFTTENYGGGPKGHLVTFLAQHPVYQYPLCFDLRHDVEPFLNISLEALRDEIKKRPKPIRTIKHSAHPILMNSNFLKYIEPYNKIGMETLLQRAKKIKKNKDLSEKLSILKKEEVEERNQNNQLDKYVEETIYNGSFPNAKDNVNLNKFNEAQNWEEKFKLKDIFEDERYSYLANRLIFENSPNLLSENDYKKIHKHFAENFLGKEKKPFTTIPSAYKAIDDLRNQHERDQKKMSQLEEINEYVQELQRFYENA